MAGIIGIIGVNTANNPADSEKLAPQDPHASGGLYGPEHYDYMDPQHKFTEQISYTAPTCTANGVRVMECSYEYGFKTGDNFYCTATQTTIIPALGHDYNAVTQDTAPTCTVDGKKVTKCSRCSDTVTTTYPALGHFYTVDVSYTPATCTTAGKHVTKCGRCTATHTETLAALGHSYGNWLPVGPTSVNQLTEQRTCTTCGGAEIRTLSPGTYRHQFTIKSNTYDNLTLTATVYTNRATPFADLADWLSYLNGLIDFDYLVCTGSVRYYDPYTERWYTGNVTKFGEYDGHMFTYYYTKQDGTVVTKHTTVDDLTIIDKVG